MSSETLETLQKLDPAVLTPIVQRAQDSPTFEILDWSVEPITHAAIIDTTGGIFRFSGQGRAASEVRPWSIVLRTHLKIK